MLTLEQLTTETATRKETRDRLRLELQAAEETYRQSRNDHDGEAIEKIASKLRLSELALEGVERDLAARRPVPTVKITHSRDTAERTIERITNQRKYRHRKLEEQIELERSNFRSGTPEEHIRIHLRNLQLDPPSYGFMRDEARDVALLEQMKEQLLEHDRLERESADDEDEDEDEDEELLDTESNEAAAHVA